MMTFISYTNWKKIISRLVFKDNITFDMIFQISIDHEFFW